MTKRSSKKKRHAENKVDVADRSLLEKDTELVTGVVDLHDFSTL